ncbi:MAG: flippase activity-associated protein Agl23 [Anaerolineae bacterium]
MTETSPAPSRSNWLDRSLLNLTTLDREKLAWAGLLIVALLIRLIALDNRTASHDEAQHAWFAYNLFTGKGYEHNPVYHGPFIYHAMALAYLLFGVSDVSARIPTALMGFGLVWLMWFTRGWLGKRGAFFAGVLLAVSPALLHYSRHTRHDIYEIFWAVLLLIAVFKYLEQGATQGRRWFYVAAAALSLALASKEDAFIHGAVIGGFLVALVLFRWLAARFDPSLPDEARTVPLRIARRDALMLAVGLGLSFIGMLLYRVLGLANSAGSATTVQTILSLAIIAVPPALAAIWAFLYRTRNADADPDQPAAWFSPATDMVILLATLIMPWVSPFLIKALGYDPLNYTTGILPTASVLAAMIGAAAVIGLLWSPRRWLIAAGIFSAIFVVFFTGLFTNGQGLATGVVGSLGYWLSQQEVARGSQPWYYYLLIVPLYEFLPLLLSLPVVLAALVRRNRVSMILLALLVALLAGWIGLTVTGDAASRESTVYKLVMMVTAATVLLTVLWGGLNRHPRNAQLFLAFLPLFILFSWFAYAVAGEKMPWLVTSITLPMCIAGGWTLGKLVEHTDWHKLGWRALWIGLLVLVLLAALLGLLDSQPFQGRSLGELSQTGQWLAALVVSLVVIAALVWLLMTTGWRQWLRVAGLTVIAVLGLWTVRTTYQANFVNQDYVVEYLFYAHGSPDPLADVRLIEDISRRTVGDRQIKVAYDDDSSWPFNWYFSTWPNAAYFGATPSREVFADAPVALIGAKNLDRARPFLQRDYYEFDRRLIWWPNEDYRNTSWQKIKEGLTNPQKRQKFLDVVLWRKYDTPTNQWPLVHRYSLFVRKDLAGQLWDFGLQPATAAPQADPYEQGFREGYASQQIIGVGPGLETGQLSFPRNVAVAADGTVYVADSGNHRIQAFTRDGVALRAWGTSCELYADGTPGCVDPDGNGPLQLGDGQMREPWGIAIGPDGNVYVADTWNHRIDVFDAQGNFLRKWGSFATTNGEAVGSPGGFWGPRAVAIDAAGNVYVTDTGNKRVQIFDAAGNFLGQLGGGGVTEGRFDEPVGLAIAPRADGAAGGMLFVADTWNRRIQKFNVTFDAANAPMITFVKAWTVEGWASQSVVNKPFLAVDSTGMVYATDPELYRVLAFDSEGTFQATFGVYGTDMQSMALPGGIAIGPNDAVYLADADNHRIMVFPPIRSQALPNIE